MILNEAFFIIYVIFWLVKTVGTIGKQFTFLQK